MQPKVVTLYVNGHTHKVALAPNVTLLRPCATWATPTSRTAARRGTAGRAPCC